MSKMLVGYIAVTADGDFAHLYENTLWLGGNEATIFNTTREVRNAVMRTRRYAKRNGWQWKWWDSYRSVKVTLP